jgi:hypothetical protein
MADDSSPGARAIEAFFWLEPFRQNTSNPFQQAKVLWHLPDDVSQISRVFSDIPQYCIPDIGKIQLEKADDAKGEFMIFTLRDGENKKVYGICYRHIFRGKNRRFDCLRRPRHCLCIITRQAHFSLFRNILQDIYAYALLEGAGGMCRQYTQSLLEPFFRETPSGTITFVPQGPESGLFTFPEMIWHIPKVMKMQFRSAPVLPLLVALGVDRLFMLLSAIMSDKKIVLIADDHQELTAAVYAALSMIHPFVWPHSIFTVAPASIVSRIISESFPFIAGIRRDTIKELPRNVFDTVVVVDLDQGMVNYTGPSPLHDLIGDSSTALKQATENLDRLRAGISSVFLGKSADNSSESSQRDIMAMLVLDLKSVMSNRPGSNSLQSVATGLLRGLPVPTVKSEEETSITWTYESEKSLRDCLTTLFVYLFGDFEDFLIFPTDSNAPFTIQHRFDRNGFFQRHSANGLGRLQEFMNDFLRTGVFKKFLVDMIKRVEMNRHLPSNITRNNRTSSVSSTTSSGSHTAAHERSTSEAAHDLDDLFFLAANELRLKQTPLTATNAKQSVTSKSTVGAGEVTLAFGLKVGNANFHQLTLLYTNAGSNEERLDNEDVQVPVWEIADKTKESSHAQTHLERILTDARNSDYIRKIFAVLSYRLESARASLARGAAGLAGLRALYVLKILLVQGPHCTLSHGLELLPLLRQLLQVKYVPSGGSSSATDFIAGQSGQHDLRPMTLRVMSLLMDHRKLMSQRHVVQTALHSKRLFFKSAMDANKGGLVALTQAKAVRKAMFFANNKQAGKQFQSFAVLHQNMNELRLRNMDAGGLKCNPFEMAELEEEGEDDVPGEDVSVISSVNPASSSSSFPSKPLRPPSNRTSELNLLDFDHASPPTSGNPAMVSIANPAAASNVTSAPATAASNVENPKYRVTNIDTGEVKHIREFQHIPYNTFDGVPPPKPARTSAPASNGSIKLQPPPNDNQQQRVSRKTAGVGGIGSDSSRSVSPVPRNQAVTPPVPPIATARATEPLRTPTQPPRNHDDIFDAFTPTPPPPAAPTPSSTPASGISAPLHTMVGSGTVVGTMKLAAGLEDLAFLPTTVNHTGPSTGLNNNNNYNNNNSNNNSAMGAASFNGVPPPRLNMTRGAMPIPSSTSSAHMMHHHAMGAPPVRPAFNNNNNNNNNPPLLPGQKPKDPFADLLSNELNRR